MIITLSSSFSINLNNLLKKHKITISKLANEIHLNISTISKLTNEQIDDPKASTLVAIAKYFDISVDQLLGLQTMNNINSTYINIPIISLAELQNNNIHNCTSKHFFQLNISGISINTKELFALQQDSPAMYPMIDKNTIIVVHKTNIYKNGQFVICWLKKSNCAVIRQIFIDEKDSVLKPLNYDFKTIQLTTKDQIIGVVIQTHRNFYDNSIK